MKKNFVALLSLVLSTVITIVACSPPATIDLAYDVIQEGYKVEVSGNPYDIPTDNCDSSRDSAKKEERSQEYVVEIQLEISDKISAEFGGDIEVAEVMLGKEIGKTLGLRIGAKTTATSAVEITTPAGKRNITSVQWKEIWTEGKIAVIRPDGTYVGAVPFAVLNSLTLEQLSSQTFDCTTGDVVSEIITPQLLPTSVPAIAPTPTPVYFGAIAVPGNSNEGIKFAATQAGMYIFRYSGGAYSTYPASITQPVEATWLTAVRIFKNRLPEWDDTAISNYPDVSAFDYLYAASQDQAEVKAQGQSVTISLAQGDYLILVAVDGKPYYADNLGEVNLEVFFSPQ